MTCTVLSSLFILVGTALAAGARRHNAVGTLLRIKSSPRRPQR
jgi:hypothetical protein